MILLPEEIQALNWVQWKCHNESQNAGWPKTEPGTRIALIHSEVSEALEGIRKDLMDEHLPHRKMVEVELADAIIRIMDFCGEEGLEIGGAIAEKMLYNRTRQDHKAEVRALQGGKKF